MALLCLFMLAGPAGCGGGGGGETDGDAGDDAVDVTDDDASDTPEGADVSDLDGADGPDDAVLEDVREDEVEVPPPPGPLRIHPDNPRYFTDDRGGAIRLAGHQIFVDLQDNSFNKEFIYNGARTLDWSWYLDFAAERNLNLIRNWIIWSFGSGATADDNNAVAHPMIYARTGPDTAVDGGPRFDLTAYDEDFFDRLRDRVMQAGERGIYVSIMLFEVYGFGDGEDAGGQTLWHGNMFRGDNNINGIDVNTNGDAWGIEFFYTDDETVLEMQRDYVRKVIDTVNDLDNVVYEIANELYAPDWQISVIELIKSYEAAMPKQHLVLMSPGGRNESGGWTLMPKSTLVDGPADIIAVAQSYADFSDPPVDDSGKPVVWDNDHIWITGWDHHGIPWMAFTRGYHYNLYDAPFESPDMESEEWERIRFSIGQTNRYAGRAADLAAMDPRGELSSTGYCLADPGSSYIVYQPASGESFTVELEAGTYAFEWYDPTSMSVSESGTLTAGGGAESFIAPFDGDAALFLQAS